MEFLILSLCLRAFASLAQGPSWVRRFPSCLLAGVSAWMILGIGGALVPLWIGLAAGALLSFFPFFTSVRGQLSRDIFLLFACLAAAVGTHGMLPLVQYGGLYLVVGVVASVLSRFLPDSTRRWLALMVAFVLLGIGLHKRSDVKYMTISYATSWPHLGFFPETKGEVIDLPSRGRAYFASSSVGGKRKGALLFHGAHPGGSLQPSALALREALLDAGYDVLSIDHKAYGSSPLPIDPARVENWDPLPLGVEGYQWFRGRFPDTPLIAVGHSMGTGDVMMLSRQNLDLKWLVLLGGGASDPSTQDAYWYERFHTDRKMAARVPENTWRQIWKKYYMKEDLARSMPKDHPPVLFVRFEREHVNLMLSRDRLFDAIPGAKEKWDLVGSGHYLDAQEHFNMIWTDTRIMKRLGDRLLPPS